jgi:hypothetical protein
MTWCKSILFLWLIFSAFNLWANDLQTGLATLIQPQKLGLAPIVPCLNGKEDNNVETNAHGISITLGFINDNKLYTLLDRDLPPISGPGDDLHYSHGYMLAIEKIEAGRWRLNVLLTGDLYGKPIQKEIWKDDSGIWHVPQHFVDDYQLRLEGDTRPQGKIFYLSAGAGIEILNSNNLPIGFLAPSAQQTMFHQTISENTPFKLKDRIQVSDGKEIQAGVNLSGGAGIQATILKLDDETLEIVFHTDIKAMISSINNASHIQQETGIELQTKGPRLPIVGRPLIAGKANSKIIFHNAGILWAPELNSEIGVEKLSLGLTWRGQYGQLHNYQRYNLPNVTAPRNDDLMLVYLKTSF